MKEKVTIIFPNNEQATKFKEATKLSWSHLDCHTHHLTCELDKGQIETIKKFKGKLKS